MTQILLIHPPVAKPGEPPVGIARLKGFLDGHHIQSHLIDANLKGILYLLDIKNDTTDRWTTQASRKKTDHLNELRSGSAFNSIDHYNRIVRDLNRLLYQQGKNTGYQLGLADCTHSTLSTARSGDLIQCAETPESNPFFEYYQNRLLSQIDDLSPNMIGLSINYLSQAFCAFALIGIVRNHFPQIKMAIGGGLITSWMQNPIWENPFTGWVDHCIKGPGEPFFKSLFNLSESKGTIVAPQFNDLKNLEYLSPGFILPYSTSTGCYWRKCGFCPECAEGNSYHQIPFPQVIEELRLLTEQTKPSLIHFLDNALSPAFLNHWIKQAPGFPWYGYVRFTEQLLDLEFCKNLKQSGCVMLKLGLESGNQDVLNQMHKGIDLNDVSIILKNLKKAGIATYVYLLFGTPGESESEARQTMNYVLEHADEIGFINPAIFNMPMNSQETYLFNTRQFNDGDLSLYVDFDHPKNWNRSEIRHFLDREFKRHPVIASILNRTPKIFTSNHAPFFK